MLQTVDSVQIATAHTLPLFSSTAPFLREMFKYQLFCSRGICIFLCYNAEPFCFSTQITHPRYGSPYPWPLNRILSYQKQWEVRRKMKAIGWAGKTLEQVSLKSEPFVIFYPVFLLIFFNRHWRVACS